MGYFFLQRCRVPELEISLLWTRKTMEIVSAMFTKAHMSVGTRRDERGCPELLAFFESSAIRLVGLL